MSNSKHSKGPWKVEKHNGKLEVWSNNHFIATPEHELFFSAEKHGLKEANARLIAAAPELLEMLKRTQGHLLARMGTVPKEQRAGMSQFINEVDALITKAEGRDNE